MSEFNAHHQKFYVLYLYVLYDTGLVQYSQLSLNGHLYKTDTSIKPTPRVGPCLSLLPLFDFL